MENSKSLEEDDKFLDAFDEFPFYDCVEFLNSSNPSQHGLRRRRRQSIQNKKLTSSPKDVEKLDSERVESTLESVDKGGVSVNVNGVLNGDNNITDNSNSVVTTDDKIEASTSSFPLIESEIVREREGERGNHNDDDDDEFSLLVYITELIVKSIGFQLNLLMSFISFPFWVLYYSCMFAVNPLFILGLGRRFVIGKLTKMCRLMADLLSPYLSEWMNEHTAWVNLVLRWGWGLFWSVYVCAVLVTLLVSAFVIGGVVMRYYVVEEPFELKQVLNFDYTKSKPAAFVPIVICPSSECGDGNVGGSGGAGGLVRVVPRKHRLQATVTMVLPESNYNTNLGIFQVRVEYLSENGNSLASLSHPCMLQFKSQPIRLLLTFFKIVPLVAGYLAETQILKLKFRGYREGVIPTACLKITMESRAEFRPGAGIPEIYDASVHLESELPFFKRILWYWRRTIFVWLSMTVFTVELLCALVCCRPIIYPRARTRGNNDRSINPLNHTVQR